MTDPETIPPIRESVATMAGSIGQAVSTWLGVGLVVNLLLLTLGGALYGDPPTDIFLGAGLVPSIVATALVLRYRPGAADRALEFGFAAFVAYVVLAFLTVPDWNTGAGLYGSPLMVLDVLLAWSGATLLAGAVVYRSGTETDEQGDPRT